MNPTQARTERSANGAAPAALERSWLDASRPAAERIESLLAAMTLPEKLAQLGAAWSDMDQTGGAVAPMQDVLGKPKGYAELTAHGIGQLTRVFGTTPAEPLDAARTLARLQHGLVHDTRLGIPATAHEECLTGFTTYRATVFPTALAWGATFDPGLIEEMARCIGSAMRALGVHQGLAPVLDVVRDYRWGRVEETLGEDPYLVGTLGTAYVRGLQSAGIVATLKHLAGYSASRAGRNHAPVSMGGRELADVILPPFEMAVRDGGANAVMHSYADVDGLPAGANAELLTAVLREQWGFEGMVVSDYWGVAFLQTMHRVATSPGDAAALALRAGVDVELPELLCYEAPLGELVAGGDVPEALVDRAVRRVLRQKLELGLLDADWSPEDDARALRDGAIELDPPESRALARRMAERSIVLLENRGGALPLAGTGPIAVVGPCADDAWCYLGCYSFPNHVLARHPDLPPGIELPSLLGALRDELPGVTVAHARGCPVQAEDRSGIAEAVALARGTELCIVAVGDRAGMFGGGTSGEGCDAEDLRLPGAQAELVEAVLETGTPVVLVVVSGRPYALGAYADRLAAAVQAFFPGEEGGPALARVLCGRVNPSGKLPVQIPRHPGGQPGTYLAPPLAARTQGISTVDPTPLYAFGHGRSYTSFTLSDLQLSSGQLAADGELELSCVVENTGERAGAEVVQLYLEDPVAQVTRPLLQLAGYARVPLEPGGRARVRFRLHADRSSFTGIAGRRIVEPGELGLAVGRAADDLPLRATVQISGPLREVGPRRVLTTPVDVETL